MSSAATTNLGFHKWIDTDAVDFEEINENFEKIDKCVICTESGVKNGTYECEWSSGGSIEWRYKVYSDGTIDLSAKLLFTNIKCNGGDKIPYYSGYATVKIPFTLSKVYNVQMHVASGTLGWISNITETDVVDHVKFRIMSPEKEINTEYKQIFINVKGVR